MSLRRIVNTAFLALSISLSGFCLYHSFENPITQKVAIIFAIMYELGNKYILADAKTHAKKGNKKYAAFLFFFYAIYIIYNIVSGAGFFISEIFKQDQISVQSDYIISSYKKELSDVEEQIDTLQKALAIEVETSYRSRAKTISEELKYYENKREELRNKLTLSPSKKVIRKNPFRDLANIIGIPFEGFMGLIWCLVMGSVCVVIYITTETLEDDKNQNVTPKNVTKKDVTPQREDKDVTKRLCSNGCGRTVKGKQTYCGACRTKISRQNKREEQLLNHATLN